MIDAFYVIVITAFATGGVLTLFSYLVRGNEIREEIAELKRKVDHVDERVAALQEEIGGLRFDSKILDDERVALEAQGKCMVVLLEAHEAHEADLREAEERGR